MRLEPIEKPPGLLMRAAYWMMRRDLGKATTPLTVVYSRAPKLATTVYRMAQAEEKRVSLDPALKLLIHAVASHANGCGFCVDIGRARAVQKGVGLEKLSAIAEYRTSPLFSDAERAALRYAEVATRDKQVPDDVFEEVRKHYSEREIVEITWVNALANFYNLTNVPLELESDGLCAIALGRARG